MKSSTDNLRYRSRRLMSIGRVTAAFVTVGLIAAACGGSETAAPAPQPAAPDAPTPEAAPFYDGKLLNVTIPFGEGGSGDFWGRFFANEIVNFLDGNVTSQAENVPGGGSIIGTNQFFRSDGSEGTQILFAASSTTVAWMLEQGEVDFDLSKAYPILGIPGNTISHVRADSGYTSVRDILDAPDDALLFGGRTPETGADVIVYVGHEVLGLTKKIRPVFGYENLGAIQLAMDQGEVQFSSRNTDSMVSCCLDKVEDGTFINLFTAGIPDASGTLVRDPIFPEIPTLGEVYEELYGVAPSGDAWEAFNTLRQLTGGTAFFFLAHPDTPAEALAELQEAANAMANDDAVRAAVANRLLEYDFVVGEELEASARAFQSIDRGAVVFIRTFLRTAFGANF